MALRIEDYALIGDCETAALVGRDGSLDWLCLPRFDSGACFAALLGSPQHGRWLIAPAEPVLHVARAYRDRTLVLDTTFETASGCVTPTDCMAIRSGRPDVVRLVRAVRGRVRMRMALHPFEADGVGRVRSRPQRRRAVRARGPCRPLASIAGWSARGDLRTRLAGRTADARRTFEALLAIRNDVGLLAEEYDPVARRQLGNFPQAFSHLGLINTARNLTQREKPAAVRAQA